MKYDRASGMVLVLAFLLVISVAAPSFASPDLDFYRGKVINYVVALLPTGLEPKAKDKSAEGIKALFYAIERGNVAYAQKVLAMNFDPNLMADNGYTPLMYAALRGDARMADLLVRNGADVGMVSKDG